MALTRVAEHHTRRLTATVPCGDAELVEGIRDHLDEVELRVVGASSIIMATSSPAESSPGVAGSLPRGCTA